MGAAEDRPRNHKAPIGCPKRASSLQEKCRPGNHETCASLAHDSRLHPPSESGPRQHPVAFPE